MASSERRVDDRQSGAAPPQVMPAGGSQIMALIRIGLGVLWLTNTNWKTPPDFGQNSGGGLYGFTRDAVDHSVFAPYSWVVEHLVLPHFTVFGWLTLLVEASLAAFLLLGLTTRLWAIVGIFQSMAVGLSVALSPGEWPWSYYLMVMAHLAVFATAAGRTWGLDGVLRPVLAGHSNRWSRWLGWAT